MLYRLGSEPGSQPYDLGVGGGGVYWTQHSGRVYGGSLDGESAPVTLGEFAGSGEGLASDDRHLYWLALNHLRRVPKAGGAVEDVELMWDHSGGAIALDQRYVYLAMLGCAAITRIDKQSLVPEIMTIPLTQTGTGSTALRVDGDELFCASWNSVFAVPGFGEEPRQLVSTATMIYGLVVLPADIYWIDRNGEVGDVLSIGHVPRSGGPVETFRPSEMEIGVGPRGLVHDAAHNALYFTSNGWVVSFSLASKQYAVHARSFPSGYVQIDDRYFYFTNAYDPSAVVRMPLDHQALLTLP